VELLEKMVRNDYLSTRAFPPQPNDPRSSHDHWRGSPEMGLDDAVSVSRVCRSPHS
jgi:hypothetical protein